MYKDFIETSFWKGAMKIAEMVFVLTNELPRKEDYGLTSQLRRASVSISANIAEAFGRSTAPDKNKFYDYARGSAFETKSLLLYGMSVNYFNETETKNVIELLEQTVYEINKVKVTLKKQSKYKPSQP
ncbi:MAG: four helix bundle protein [Bacteroidetes bacterium]|nr:four helix bundle protein [Bacteroidota bacterium]